MIKLTVPAREKEPEKNYSFQQLEDLHDKLTLVVGKSEEHQKIIRYFEDVITIYEIILNIYQNTPYLWPGTKLNKKIK